MKKILLTLVTLLLLAFAASAQDTRDVIYLYNGSIIKGQIVEMVPYGNVRIATADGSVFVYSMAEVAKIEKEAVNPRKLKKNFNKPTGYFGHVSLSVPYFVVGVNMINGYRFCPEFAMGIGIGVEVYEYSALGIPIYLHLRSDFLGTRVSPYISFDAGYKIGVSPFVSPQIGVSYNVGKIRMTTGIEVPCHFFGFLTAVTPAITVGFSF